MFEDVKSGLPRSIPNADQYWSNSGIGPNVDQFQLMPINSSQFRSMPYQAELIQHWSALISIDQYWSALIGNDWQWSALVSVKIDRHWSWEAPRNPIVAAPAVLLFWLCSAAASVSPVFTNVLLMSWSGIDRHWSALRGIGHWSRKSWLFCFFQEYISLPIENHSSNDMSSGANSGGFTRFQKIRLDTQVWWLQLCRFMDGNLSGQAAGSLGVVPEWSLHLWLHFLAYIWFRSKM